MNKPLEEIRNMLAELDGYIFSESKLIVYPHWHKEDEICLDAEGYPCHPYGETLDAATNALPPNWMWDYVRERHHPIPWFAGAKLRTNGSIGFQNDGMSEIEARYGVVLLCRLYDDMLNKRSLEEANKWLIENWSLVDEHAKKSTQQLIGREEV